MTPKEACSGVKPSVDNCKVFWSSSESKGYKMFDPTTNKIIVSRNVVFEKKREWDCKFFFKVKQNWTGENIEIDENTAEEGEITEETTKLVAETIEPVAENEEGKITKETTKPVAETIELVPENNFPVAVALDLTIRKGRNRHLPAWLVDYNSSEGL